MKNKYLLKNWSFCNMYSCFIAEGNVYCNPKFEDGTFIHTSTVEDINIVEDHLEVETRNSIYCIYSKDINKEFELIYPEFYEELYKRIDDIFVYSIKNREEM